MDNKKRYFEVTINGNFNVTAYTLIVKCEKTAVKKATKEAKQENNDTICIIEVDKDGNLIDGFCSGTIIINKN